MEQSNESKGFLLKPYTLTEIAQIYGVSVRTMHQWMGPFKEKIGAKRGRYYTIPQVKVFFDNLSLPSIYLEK